MGKHHANQTCGFTLIELSIVLVIIGLIVGGILTGRDLIGSATNKSVVTDVQKYVSAVNTFRTKYNELPGDMVDAQNMWGTDPNGCPDLGPTPTQLTATTCNGNGNGIIESEGVAETFPAILEGYRAWQQLANAHLIQGTYSGVPTTVGNPWSYSVGVNIPATRIPNAGFAWEIFNNGQENITGWNAQNNVQYLWLGAPDSSGKLFGYVLPPADAMAIDSKIDDGLPATGNVLASQSYPGTYPWCITTTFPNGVQVNVYDTTVKAPGCTLLFAVKSW